MTRDPVRSQIDIFFALITVTTIVFLDRFSKIYFSHSLALGESWPVLRGIFHITLVNNTGIAFGLFKNQGIVFIIIPLIAIVLLIFNIYYYRNNQENLSRTYIVAFSLILGGAIGNLIDRIYLGYVIDFLDFRVWPVFNIADASISVGILLLAIHYVSRSL